VNVAFDGELGDRKNSAISRLRRPFAINVRTSRSRLESGIRAAPRVDPELDPSELVQHIATILARQCDLPRNCVPHDPGEACRMRGPLDDPACAGPHDREDHLPVRSSHDRDGLGRRRPPLDARDRLNPATRGMRLPVSPARPCPNRRGLAAFTAAHADGTVAWAQRQTATAPPRRATRRPATRFQSAPGVRMAEPYLTPKARRARGLLCRVVGLSVHSTVPGSPAQVRRTPRNNPTRSPHLPPATQTPAPGAADWPTTPPRYSRRRRPTDLVVLSGAVYRRERGGT
jgi:hypothetical protein